MVEMLDRLENVLGKGAKAHGIAKMYEMSGCARVSRVELDKGFAGVRPSESSPPSYILRDPCLKPIIADVLLESVTTSHSTTSKPLSLWFRKDNALTVAAAMNSAALECKGGVSSSVSKPYNSLNTNGELEGFGKGWVLNPPVGGIPRESPLGVEGTTRSNNNNPCPPPQTLDASHRITKPNPSSLQLPLPRFHVLPVPSL